MYKNNKPKPQPKKSLCELYRPRTFDEVVGQDKAVAKIRRMLLRGWGGRAWWISGPSGSGKTTLAHIIARWRRGGVLIKEFDSANDVKMAFVQRLQKTRRYASLLPNRVYIVNEAHSMRKPIIQSLLGVLEHLHKDEVFIFTTTKIGEEGLLDEKIDAEPLLSRCVKIELTDQGLTERFAHLCYRIAKKEGLDGGKKRPDFIKLARRCKNNCRKMLIEIGPYQI